MGTPCSPGTHSRWFSLQQRLCGEDKGNKPRLPRSQRKGNHRDHIQSACQCSIPSKPLVPLPRVPHTGRCCLLQCLEICFLFLWLNISHSQPESSCCHSKDALGFPPPSQAHLGVFMEHDQSPTCSCFVRLQQPIPGPPLNKHPGNMSPLPWIHSPERGRPAQEMEAEGWVRHEPLYAAEFLLTALEAL